MDRGCHIPELTIARDGSVNSGFLVFYEQAWRGVSSCVTHRQAVVQCVWAVRRLGSTGKREARLLLAADGFRFPLEDSSCIQMPRICVLSVLVGCRV